MSGTRSTGSSSATCRWRRRVLVGLVLLSVSALATFSLPVQSWRTGQDEWIALTTLGPEQRAALPRRLWIDTDAACGQGSWTDPDDCLALFMLLQLQGVEIVGISTVFGNASLAVTDEVARELIRRHREAGGREVAVYSGCARATSNCNADNEAVAALRAAIAAGPLTILALGPLTNVAQALQSDPARRPDVQVVAVMGRRPGHRFHPTEGRSTSAMLFGHGPVFSDLNLRLDPQAAASVLAAAVPVTLVPYEAARSVHFGEEDLTRIAAQGELGAWVEARSRDWLAQWRRSVGLGAFYPFDLVAAMYLAAPERFACARVLAWVGRDFRRSVFERDPALLVTQDEPPDAGVVAMAPATYCTEARMSVAEVL